MRETDYDLPLSFFLLFLFLLGIVDGTAGGRKKKRSQNR